MRLASCDVRCGAGAARPAIRCADPCRAGAGARPHSRTASGLRRERHLRGLSRRQGRLAQGHRSTRRRRIRARRRRPRAARAATARGRRTWTTTRKGTSGSSGRSSPPRQPDVPDVPQPRRPRGLGGQRARAPQSLVQHVPQRAQPEVARTPARQGDRDRSCAPRATGCR